MLPRSSGILLHVTSLPSPFGIGDLGPSAFRFVDYLAEAGQRVWQVLPLNPVGLGNSPYASPSTFAGNPMLISPERLLREGYLGESDLADLPDFPRGHVDFEAVEPFKTRLLERAYERFKQGAPAEDRQAFERYCERHAHWLDDYALFMALKEKHDGAGWTQWPDEIAHRDEKALAKVRSELGDRFEQRRFWQFLFDRHWSGLRAFAHARGVSLLGDMPIYVAHDSADVWAHPDRFDLDEDGNPNFVAGVPPDYFSETGQRWGNPLYRWDVMQKAGFKWWRSRLARTLEWVDVVRLDHFRGFEAYWAVPAEEETAINGEWVQAPGAELFEAFREDHGDPLPVVAEDLGVITDEVRALRDRFHLPGMAVLQFGFGGDTTADFLPHRFVRNSIAYTGTHDNDTFLGFWRQGATDDERRFGGRYLGLDRCNEEVHWAAIRALMASVADTVVFPLQDVLGLGTEARMNTPGSETGNWSWRFTDETLSFDSARRLRQLAETYGRLAEPEAEPAEEEE
jgi:4-alpha-glucanotransferase